MIDNNDISPTGAGSRHNKNPSFLTKDFNISRHERRKSAMDSEPCITDNSTGGGVSAAPYASANATLNAFDSNNEQLRGNLSLNDK
mmetsp:Transcript_7555/g.9118  ORF Transcript_7555/g.9118 Transcript_7555/m.9118 type:complete len:86 (+) Transcript_7555:595-852(+)